MLSDEQSKIFRQAFNGQEAIHIDGWTSERGRKAFAHAERLGFVTSFVTQESQYTAINYTITPAGRAALEQEQ